MHKLKKNVGESIKIAKIRKKNYFVVPIKDNCDYFKVLLRNYLTTYQHPTSPRASMVPCLYLFYGRIQYHNAMS